jgi:hypothetical protein
MTNPGTLCVRSGEETQLTILCRSFIPVGGQWPSVAVAHAELVLKGRGFSRAASTPSVKSRLLAAEGTCLSNYSTTPSSGMAEFLPRWSGAVSLEQDANLLLRNEFGPFP